MKSKTILNVFLLLITVFVFGEVVDAEVSYQYCQAGTNCVLGEFLYDDYYNPITDDVCKVEVKDPSGGAVVDNASTTYNNEDGWHEYVFSTSGPEGFYRASLCCKSGGETICVDKSFILQIQKDKIDNVVPLNSSNFATKKDLDNLKNLILGKIDDLLEKIKDTSAVSYNYNQVSGLDLDLDLLDKDVLFDDGSMEGKINQEYVATDKELVKIIDFRTIGNESNKIVLSWSVFPSDYKLDYFLIYRNDIPIATTTSKSFTDLDLFPNTEYSYKVSIIKDKRELIRAILKTVTKIEEQPVLIFKSPLKRVIETIENIGKILKGLF